MYNEQLLYVALDHISKNIENKCMKLAFMTTAGTVGDRFEGLPISTWGQPF